MVTRYHRGEKDNRPWGTWEVLDTDDHHSVKRLVVYPGRKLSLQHHQFRAEHWVVVSGTATVTRNREVLTIQTGEHIHIPKGDKHRLENKESRHLVVIEVQYGEKLDEDDIIRHEDDFGRV